MIEALTNITGAFGLSTSAGLNAYLPLLVVALAARFSNLVQLNEPWDVLTNWWVIGVLTVLLFIEMTVDKIPAVDTINDIIQTAGRPLAGAVIFAASSGVVGELHPVLALIAGLLLAGGVHTAKSVTRPVITAMTGGMGNWFISIVEDIIALITAILSIFLPIIMSILIIVAAFLLFSRWRKRSLTPQTA